MKAFLFFAFLAVVPALADRLWSAPTAASPTAVALATGDDRDDLISRETDRDVLPWCGTRS
jgi:hypothetical protein